MKKYFLFAIVLMVFSLVNSCKKEKSDSEPHTQQQPTDETIISKDVVEIDTTQTGAPAIEGNNYTFTNNGNLPEFTNGDIIVSNSGFGYMRRITNITTQGNDVILNTSQATLEEVIENCNIQDEIQLTLNKAIYKGIEYPSKVVFIAKGASISDRGSIDLSGLQIYSGTYNGVDVTAQIDQGSINFEPIITREIEIRRLKLKHLRLSSGGDLDFTCDASIIANAPISFKKEKLVAQIYFGPFPFGPVPVFIVLSFKAGIDANLNITGSLGSGFDTEAYLEYGADYTDSQWSTIWEKSIESNSHGVTWDLSGETDSKVYVSPEVGFLVAGAAGPYMEAVPYLGFDGNINLSNQTWNWDLSAGTEGNIGFSVELFGLTLANYSTTLANWETTIAQDNGETGSNTPPSAIFTVSPFSGSTSTVFGFDASNSTDDEDPTSQLQVRWDFDGNGSWDTNWDSDKTEDYQYSNEGDYTAKMEVKDSEGLSDQYTKSIIVSNGGGNTPPTAIFTVSPSSGTTSTNFSFDASGSTDPEEPTSALQVRWDFDGNGSWDTNWDTDKTEDYQYSNEGDYTAKMEVKDSEGLSDQYTKSITVNNGGGGGGGDLEWINVSGGTFQMGSNDGDSDEQPIHTVTVSSFEITKYEITNGQYCEFLNNIGCNSNGSHNDVEYIDMNDNDCQINYSNGQFIPESGKTDFPVIEVSWYGSNAFAQWAGGRLPTEAEWEFAARGGNNSNGYTYSGSNTADNVAWYNDNSGGNTHQVGTKATNELGIHDMSGNAWEWCNDWYDNNYYNSSPQNNPQGPSSGSYRVPRGGSWFSYTFGCRVAYRTWFLPVNSNNVLGFRIAR